MIPALYRAGRAAVAALAAVLAVTVAPLPAMAHPGHEHDPDSPTVLIFTATTQFRHTEAITQGTPVLQQAFSDAGIDSVHSEDPTLFTDESLAGFDALVMFQTSGDPWNADQKAAMERYQQAGGGIVAIHNATDMRGGYAWWDGLVGALMPGHAATGSSPGLPGTVRVEDRVHPSTAHLDQRWDRADEWYNYSANVRGSAHVLATMDESTYDPGGNAMGYDHPISWCKPYDGGRAWVTGMGHFGAHYTEPDLVQHIVGGVQWAAGLVEGDCGGTDWGQFEKVSLDTNTSAPFAMDVAPDGRVFYTELVRGQIRVYDPATQGTSTAVTLPVYSGGEDGLLGIALDPDFATNGWLYVYRSPASANDSDPASFFNVLSRFTVGAGSQIDPASEVELLRVPARRLPDEPGHTGGGLDFDAQGNLYLGVGDDVNPHSEPSGGYAPLSTRPGTFHDARETSANTNDLRGKLLRIHPEDDGTYTIPDGNLFAPGTELTRPEIYAMGFRNPFRFSVDQQTGHISMADYSPDNGSDNLATRGPAGIAEWNYITEPGNYGWPMCMGANEPFRDVDYETNPVTVGDFFDCDTPVNDSPRNTGLTELPPVKPADMFYGYQRSSVPGAINQGGGLAPMGGPVYRYDAELESDTKFPEYYDGKPFFYEWARNRMYSIDLSESGVGTPGEAVEKVNPFLPPPAAEFLAPIDSKFGPDGSMYVLDWGGGFGRDNPDSGLHRIDYVSGSRSPSAVATATPDSGQAPLEVTFDGSASTDPEGEQLTYAWDLDGDGTTDAEGVEASWTYEEEGVYDARLTVTDPAGKTGTTTVPITVGNTRPDVSFVDPPTGGFFHFGDQLSWDVEVTDAEDATIDDAEVIIQPALGHDAHAHPSEPLYGRTGTVQTSLGGGHSDDMNVFYVLDARYTDSGGEGGANRLTGSDTSLLFPMQREAEFFSSSSEGVTTLPSRDVEGHGAVVSAADGWTAYDPLNLRGVDELSVRYAAAADTSFELRAGAPDGELLGTLEAPATGSLTRFADVTWAVPADAPTDSFTLYLVMPGEVERRVNFLEAHGLGVSDDSHPEVAITAPEPYTPLTAGEAVELTAEASDPLLGVTGVEFLVDGQSLGTDTEAPYSTTWTPAADGFYELTAVATNAEGRSTTSRIVVAQVGEPFGDFEQFTNANGVFTSDGDGVTITSGGANMWQGTDEYSSLYLPQAGDESWSATVRIPAQGNSNNSAKAGILVRDDVTQPGTSPGYAALGIRPNGGFEWLRDTDGNGQLDASTSASTTSYPAWVRLARSGDRYFAYWSKDGETFTQVGDPVELPGATSTQDVGLFVTAHSSTATSEVQFDGWVFEDEWTPPSEEEPEPGPSCLTSQSDEFDGDTLSGRWTTQRAAEGSAISVSDGALRLPVTGGDINEASTGPISFVGQPARDGAWEATTRLTLPHTREWQHAGMLLHASDDDYVKLAFTRSSNGGRLMEFQTEAGGSRTWHANVALPQDFPSTVDLRLTSDGTALTASYSTDGTTWTALAGQAAVLDGATLGLVAAGDTGTPEATAAFDWYRVTPDSDDDGTRGFADEFDGDALDGCRWDRVVRYDSSEVAVADGALRITTQPGDINNENPIEPRNFILQDAPEGEEWTVETRLTGTMQHRWQYAGLLAYGSDDEYVKLDVVADNAPGAATNLRTELVSEVGGQFGAGGNRSIDIAETSESGWWYLRLTRSGDTYTGWVSDGGVTWTQVGEPVTHAGDLDAVGLVAVGPEQESPVTVAFDWIRLADEEPPGDTTAPVTTAALDPSTPDGENGWYTTAPTLTLTADDGDGSGVAGTEYQVDGGAWVAYSSPVELPDGDHTIAYRSTDEAGNVEEAGTLEVQVDTTGPVTEAATSGDGDEVTVTLTATDATSGVASTEVSVDGGDWAAYEGPVVVTGAGTHTVEYRSTDVAGNVETTKSVVVDIVGDGEGPTVTVTGVAHGTVYGDSQRLTLAWEALDSGSGVASVTATLDGQALQPGELRLDALPLGLHDLVVTATDVAGNITEQVVRFGTATSFEDVAQLLRTYRAENRLTAAEARVLQGHLERASAAALKGRKAQVRQELGELARYVRANVADPLARSVLDRDARALRERLVDGMSSTRSGARTADDPTEALVAPLR